MKNILITGATGNIGFETVRFLKRNKTQNNIIIGARNIKKAQKLFSDFADLDYVHFDFENQSTLDKSLVGIDTIFLLRPPHISDVETYFRPLMTIIESHNKNMEIIFISVQGAEKTRVIPHNKIERLIIEFGFKFIFLRPSYFMQNLTTTLLNDIKTKRQIILPAGKAKFNWIDVKNIGEIGSILLDNFDKYKNQAYEITGLENENFYSVTQLITEGIKNPLNYRNVNPFHFFSIKKKQGMEKEMIIVMILLHFLPRFQKEPRISDFYTSLTGKKTTSLKEFIEREKELFD